MNQQDQVIWKEKLTKKINSVFDNELRSAIVGFDWFSAADDIGGNYAPWEEPVIGLFKRKMTEWIQSSTRNKVLGLDKFNQPEVIFGCTQFIDDLAWCEPNRKLRLSKFDYPYYSNISGEHAGYIEDQPLCEGDVVLISFPHTLTGGLYPNWDELLEKCQALKIPVYVDSAWFGTCSGLTLDYSHPAIKAVGFSLSKGLGLGYYRIGLRFTKTNLKGPIAEQNHFSYLPYVHMHLGLHMMNRFSCDYLQNKYHNLAQLACAQLGLQVSPSIHLAHGSMSEWSTWDRTGAGSPIVGLAHLLRYMHEVEGRPLDSKK